MGRPAWTESQGLYKGALYLFNLYVYFGLASNNGSTFQFMQEWTTKDERSGRLYPKLCDLCHENDVLEMFRWIETYLGGADVLVNNAGITGQNSLIGEN